MYKIYQSKYGEVIIHTEKNLWIPSDPANTDYQEYLAWVAKGNEAEEWSAE